MASNPSSPPPPFNDPSLEVVAITDFTPGVYVFGVGSYNYSASGPRAPLGSASQAYRCYAKKNVGLIPFPRYNYPAGAMYQPTATLTAAGDFSLGGLRSVMVNGLPSPSNQLPDILAYNTLASPTSNSPSSTTFNVNYLATTTLDVILNTNYYTHTLANTVITVDPYNGSWYPGNFDTSFFQYGSPPQPQRSVVCVDTISFLNGQLTWVVYPQWNGSATNGNITQNPSLYFFPTPKVFFVNGRTCFTFLGMTANPVVGFNNYTADAVVETDVQAMTITAGQTFNPNYYYPEFGIDIGTWGSISDGEFFFVYRGGGAVVIYGDVNQPSSVTKLPGVVGTGIAKGAATQTGAGLIYVTDTDGAYLWNGGNTAQKISSSVPDDQFYRTNYPGYVNVHNDVWGQWYMAANNWMWDAEHGGWWQVEDPNIVRFNMHAASVASLNVFYSADGYTTLPAAGTARLNIYSWQRNIPSHNYTWTSSAITQPGQLADLQWVEICASNPTPTACTIVAQPSSLPTPNTSGTTNPPPHMARPPPPGTFTIPANTVSYRESARLGYTDYNITIKITANNPGSGAVAPAPILHELIIGYTQSRTSGGRQ